MVIRTTRPERRIALGVAPYWFTVGFCIFTPCFKMPQYRRLSSQRIVGPLMLIGVSAFLLEIDGGGCERVIVTWTANGLISERA